MLWMLVGLMLKYYTVSFNVLSSILPTQDSLPQTHQDPLSFAINKMQLLFTSTRLTHHFRAYVR